MSIRGPRLKIPSSVGGTHKIGFPSNMAIIKDQKSPLEMAWRPNSEKQMVISRAPGHFPDAEFDIMHVSMLPRGPHIKTGPQIIKSMSVEGFRGGSTPKWGSLSLVVFLNFILC